MNKLKIRLKNLLDRYKISIYKLQDTVFVVLLLTVFAYITWSSLQDNYKKQIEEQKPEENEEVSEVEVDINEGFDFKDTLYSEKEASETPSESINLDSEVKTNKIIKSKEVEYGGFYFYDSVPLKEDTQKYIWKVSEEYGLSYEMVLSVAKVESNFDPKVVTSEGSYGLYQLHKPSGTFDWLATTVEAEFDNIHNFRWDNPKHNASAAIWYLNWLSEQWEGNSEEDKFALTLGSFNMGLSGFKDYIKTHSPYEWHYVDKVLDYKIKLEKERYN